ncbi:MAG: hypothetical protein K0R12_175 [Gammaproteobacteria bacterium]|nr:hypothetical protein [Gammaproteobacteria bacterium]
MLNYRVILTTLNEGESVKTQNWRRERDSNPRYGLPYTHFPGVLLQPLGHLSTPNVEPESAKPKGDTFFWQVKNKAKF